MTQLASIGLCSMDEYFFAKLLLGIEVNNGGKEYDLLWLVGIERLTQSCVNGRKDLERDIRTK